MISLALTLLMLPSPRLHFVAPDSLVIDSSHYVTWSKTSIVFHDSEGTKVTSSPWPKNITGRLVSEQGRLIVQQDRATSVELIFESLPSPAIHFAPAQRLDLQLSSNGRTFLSSSDRQSPTSYHIDPPQPLLNKMIDHPPGSVSTQYYRDGFAVVNLDQPVNARNGPFSALYIFLVTNGRAVLLSTPMKYAQATYCDERYLLGYTTNDEEMLWHHFGRDVTASPFVCDLSDMNVRLLKKVERIMVPKEYAWDDSMGPNLDGSVRIYPQTITADGKLILCNRIQEGPDKIYEGVVLFRNGQAEMIDNLVVEGNPVRPIRVTSAQGSLAILQGQSKSGELVSFVYNIE